MALRPAKECHAKAGEYVVGGGEKIESLRDIHVLCRRAVVEVTNSRHFEARDHHSILALTAKKFQAERGKKK